jgi:hypothetical protein
MSNYIVPPESFAADRDSAIRHHEVTPSGVPFNWGLANCDGAWFHLLVEPGTTKEAIASAKTYLKQTRDVVRIDVLRPATTKPHQHQQ